MAVARTLPGATTKFLAPLPSKGALQLADLVDFLADEIDKESLI
jgi:hypothetical protein